MAMTDAHALNEMILAIYREGREVPLGNFQAWALERVKGLIDFDSAWWGNAAANPHELHEVHLHNCTQAFLEVHPAHHEQDFFHAALIAAPGVSINLSDLVTRARYMRTPHYRGLGQRFRMEWSLGTLLIEPVSSLYEFLTLWRHDPRQPFSEAERQTKELLMPHLAETHRTVRLPHVLNGRSPQHREWALVDERGFLRDASPAFIARVQTEWPDWCGSRLPEPLGSLANARTKDSIGTRFDVTRCGTLSYVQAKSEGALTRLSSRQREVAVRYANGETHTEIAAALSLSPATVRNHIAQCFRKLTVNNKAELAQRLQGTA